MASYQATYANNIKALHGKEIWVHTNQIPPIPPKSKKKVGRPYKEQSLLLALDLRFLYPWFHGDFGSDFGLSTSGIRKTFQEGPV
ncbi:hypothetical protein VNO77_27317 [Canavalia gladiata]|uniref:Uncharacterized protein n=1 Tax=Canavalia gladiata TaxID=3824 RepID=A0AAN9Q6C8_CANGL